MPRPRKCRRVCGLPDHTEFGPPARTQGQETVFMTVDEFEAIRLIDQNSLTQEEAALRMNVARTTIQAIYNSARKKLADCLVSGLPLRIEGGDVEICGAQSTCPRHCQCGQAPCKEQKE